MLVPKGFLRLGRVGRNAEHRGLAFGKSARQPRKVDGLPGAARRIRARIEEQHQFLPGIVGKRDGARRRRAADGRRAPWPLRPRRICLRTARELLRLTLSLVGGFPSLRPTRSWLCAGEADFATRGGFDLPASSRPVFARDVLADACRCSAGGLARGMPWRRSGALSWVFSYAFSWTYAFLSSLSADQSWAIPGLVLARPNRAGRWANLMASEYGYKDSTLHRPLVERAPCAA